MSPNTATTRNRISLSSDAGERHSPVAWIAAILLHAAVIAATFFTFAHRLDIVTDSTSTVPVDLITIAPKTNITPQVTEQKAPPKDQQVTPQPDQPVVPTPTPAPSQPAEAAPPKLDAAAKPVPTPTPAPRAKPQPAAPDKKPSADQALAALLNKLTAPAATPKNIKVGSRTINGVGDMNQMNADLKAALQGEIAQCWSPPVGAPHPERLIVDFELFLNKDGSVAQPPQLSADSAAAAAGDPFMRAAVDAARRAIYTCAPYKLPPDRYNDWRDITFTFDPAKMVGAQ
ncbi:MAG: hypothetical protein ACREHE_15050 [Rhizomicrobium sp.]